MAEYGITPTLELGPVQVMYVRGGDMGGGVGGLRYSLRPASTGALPTVAGYKHFNARGDVLAQSNAAGQVTWAGGYESGGKRLVEKGTMSDRQKANTKEEDPSGLLNEGFRYRDMEIGMFISRDPAGFVDGPNVYTYVVQNPWSMFDPEGLWGVGESNGGFLDGLWNKALVPGSQFVAEASAGYIEVVFTGKDMGASMSTSGAAGRNFGRFVGTLQAASEVVAGPPTLAAGLATDAAGAEGALFTGGGSLILEAPGTLAIIVGTVETAHGAYALKNATKLGFKEAPAGSSGSPDNSAKDTQAQSEAEGEAAKTGETTATKAGRQAHKDWEPGEGFDKEVTLPSGKRADAVNLEAKHVKELKPDNPRAVKRGEKQVEGYRQELEKEHGGDWTSSVETYKR